MERLVSFESLVSETDPVKTVPIEFSVFLTAASIFLYGMNVQYHTQMKNLPSELQAGIIKTLDPKSKARLRATSKALKSVVDSTQPPTGSYSAKTGRFQKRFPLKGMTQCIKKHQDAFLDMDSIEHHDQFRDYGFMVYKDLKTSYDKNTLFRDFRTLTHEQTEDAYLKTVLDAFPNMKSDAEFRQMMKAAWHEETKQKVSYRRRVIRLLKAWTSTDARYKETLSLVRRRTATYTPSEEKAHKDRLMDAIIVQSAVLHPADDPTRTILNSRGHPMSLTDKINLVVKRCTSTLKEQKKHKKKKKNSTREKSTRA